MSVNNYEARGVDVEGAQAAMDAAMTASSRYMAELMAHPGVGINPDDIAAASHADPPLPAYVDPDAGTQGMRGRGERS